MSRITSHVLDTSKGRPAPGIIVTLFMESDHQWRELGRDVTNEDGRVTALADPDVVLPRGNYKLHFETGTYFEQRNIAPFYPSIEIIFHVNSGEHYHVPLLLSPFGYSTYRGS
jgi:5-hydroxyisourate hydrolase